MLRYFAAAQALKMLSVNTHTKRFYRNVLGVYGARRRMEHGLTDAYLERSRLLIALMREYGLLREGVKMLEVGTGWMHFFGIVPCLVAPLRVLLADVWDCRQFPAFRRAFGDLEAIIDREYPLSPAEALRAHRILGEFRQAQSFEDVYRAIGATYLVDHTGKNALIQGEGLFDVIVSFHVLEHVRRENVAEHLAGCARLLKPGGYQIHQIGIDDHLAHYDRAAHVKSYLQFSEKTWRTWFENDLQYINRIQLSEWLARFQATGMTLVHLEAQECDVSGLDIHPEFADLEARDLKCTIPTVVLRKPG